MARAGENAKRPLAEELVSTLQDMQVGRRGESPEAPRNDPLPASVLYFLVLFIAILGPAVINRLVTFSGQ
jgi:Flp pilus assembly protein TadB